MALSLRSYHHNVLKKLDLSYGARESALYIENDSLQTLKDDLEDMEESLKSIQQNCQLRKE